MGEQDMGEQQTEKTEQQGQQPEQKAKLIFADPLDRQTSDDTDSGWGERPGSGGGGGRGLDWYVSQRPPHHG
ncbi:hypothetical protein [Kitasatospora sp. MAP5-34]|uniref:hypothetical protein n=1 Tax=Kitasatospora sp. MAP5-34 TaxID=3035102 RepID=UPI002476F14D|nr:hypothetical protein [Kitasatospora sp. MAP5-34]MDH6577051.1 hypothetical protein [Kitasatospora sp. MAP5-34]